MIRNMSTSDYHKKYIRAKRWKCTVCDEDMVVKDKYKHLEKDYHLINVENMKSKGLEIPAFKRISTKNNWECPVCNIGKPSKNKWSHISTKMHRDNVAYLEEMGIPVPDFHVNRKFTEL